MFADIEMCCSSCSHLCTEDAREYSSPWDIDMLTTYADPPDCSCETLTQECPEGAAGYPPNYWLTGTADEMYNLTDNQFTTSEYLLRSRHQFLRPR